MSDKYSVAQYGIERYLGNSTLVVRQFESGRGDYTTERDELLASMFRPGF